ncbi:N-acetylmuramoyl-L-alanine amidase [Phreatobacter stygius]|nr:N-acetylmuramoyl-L-alanine amidase [Phreatobacter stygius]
MSITNHWIDGIDRINLLHNGANQTPRLVVIHYSVTNTVAAAVEALNSQRLSYHILIEKDGEAFQTRRFTESAAHPGLSNWKAAGNVGLGHSVQLGSVGICLMNKGFDFDASSPNAPGQLIYNPDDPSMQRWETYPRPQLAACKRIVRDIIDTYDIQEVVGHHDIAIMGKFDPGPLFDIAGLNVLIASAPRLGFRTTVRSPDGRLRLRRGPSAETAVVAELQNGREVHVRSIAYGPRSHCIDPNASGRKRYLTRWASVGIDGADRHAGFVNMKFLAATPLTASLAAFL